MYSLLRGTSCIASYRINSILARPVALSSTSVSAERKQVPYKTLKDEKSDTVSVPNRADAVVIGGGSVGCSTLYHLSKLGLPNSVLVEKNQLTSGTTWHSAGLLWRLRSDETDAILSNITRELMDTLEQETGVNSGFHMNGGLFLGSRKERLEEFKRLKAFGESIGVESHVLTPDEAQELYPLMSKKDVYAALYSPTDGHIDPAGYCTALSRAAKTNGAQVYTDCEVTEIETFTDSVGRRKVKAVNTSKGRIETDNVILCGGCWSPHITESLGLELPQYSFEHAYIVTETIEGVKGMPSIRDHDKSMYLKVQGDVLQIGGFEPAPVFRDKERELPKDFSFGLFDLDWESFEVIMERACERIPQVGQTGIRSTVSGLESFTPDGKPLLGPNPSISGLFHAHALNSGGMMLSGGCGQMLAEWVINGEPGLVHMFNYDIRRFSERMLRDKKAVRELTHENYTHKYGLHFNYDEPLAGRPGVKDALYDKLLEEGCVYQFKGGWERPGWFDGDNVSAPLPYDYNGEYGHTKNNPDPYAAKLALEQTYDHPQHQHKIRAECMNARTNVNLFNMSYYGKFYLTGPEATEAAEWIFSNNMENEPGVTTHTLMLNKLGAIESDLTVSVVEDDGPQSTLGVNGRSYYVAVDGEFSPYVKARILESIAQEKFDCKLTDVSHDMSLLSLQGPQSRAVLNKLCPDTDFSNERFPFSSQQLITIGGHRVRAVRWSNVGELGWELHMANESAVDVYDALINTGEEFGLRNSGYRAINSLSIEKGYRMWHYDIRSNDSPLEANMESLCKIHTGKPFVGREKLESYKGNGVQKRLVCFTLDKSLALHGLETIHRNGEIVGYIRRAGVAFTLDKEIAWGYVRNSSGLPVTKDYIESGIYQVDRMGQLIAADAHMESPFDPDSNRLLGFYD